MPFSQLPGEENGPAYTVQVDAEGAAALTLTRGQYRVSFTTSEAVEEAFTLPSELLRIPMEGELKRVLLYKLDALPDENSDGEPVTRWTAVFRVIDNPLPLIPIVYGVLALCGLVGGWFLIDKVEEFTESPAFKILAVAAAAVTVFVLLRSK